MYTKVNFPLERRRTLRKAYDRGAVAVIVQSDTIELRMCASFARRI